MSTCPSCGDDANVDKVSGVYRTQSAGYGGSNLARLLAPPHIDAVLPQWNDIEQGCLMRVLAITACIGVVTSLYMSAAYGWGSANLIVGFIIGVMGGIVPTVAIMWMLLHRHFGELEKAPVAEAEAKS